MYILNMDASSNTQDDEQLSFITISAATKNVIRWLDSDKQQNEDRKRQTGRDTAEKEDAENHRDAVDQRLRELRAFERRYGKKV
jgi:hypothetical protein